MIYIYVFIGAILFIFILVMVLGFYFYNFSIKRKDEYEPLEKYYVNLSKEKEWLYSNKLLEVTTLSNDGLKLHGKYLKAIQNTNKLAIVVHGYTSKGDDMAGFAHLFHEKFQYNVLLPDLRGHGESEGNYIGFGYHDHHDLLKWIEYSINHFGDDVQILLLGISMGGATVCMTSGEELPHNVKCIISDCAYDSIENILSYHMKKSFKIPKFPLLHVTSSICNKKAKFKFSEGNVIHYVKKSKTPILFIHGGSDNFVPTAMVHNLYNSVNCEKDLLIVEGAKHGMAYDTDPISYNKKLSQFITNYIQ